ncbi:MAG: DeoR/GlpR transcriptional regulator [Clostridia bacterium]|nr:DeoR/GlpR transcriptional regulator [Clostridia bacterium]
MYKKERIDKIMSILCEKGYVNVKYLCDELGYSKATVNRDLNDMEHQKMVKRSYGAVELTENKDVALEFRYHKMKREKMKISKFAAGLVKDGETIFIDASSTTEFMAPYLVKKNNLTVITNNLAIVSYLSGYSNIRVICLGGEVMEPPSMMSGDLCVRNAMIYKADKFFFATHSIDDNGEIGGGGKYNLVIDVMAQNSRQVIYLTDHTKMNLASNTVVMTVDRVDMVVSDYKFSEEFKKRYQNTKFIEL